jgi:hypothetical protein
VFVSVESATGKTGFANSLGIYDREKLQNRCVRRHPMIRWCSEIRDHGDGEVGRVPREKVPMNTVERAKWPKLTRPSCRRWRSILYKLPLEYFAPVCSRSAPGSSGAKFRECVIGVDVARGSTVIRTHLGVSIRVFLEGEEGRVGACVLSDAWK